MAKIDIDKTFLRDLKGEGDITIDATDPANLSNKVLGEREYRKRLLSMANKLGCKYDMMMIFAKYDKLMRNCSNEQERLDMGKLGVIEMYNLLDRGTGGELYVNGELVCQGQPDAKRLIVPK